MCKTTFFELSIIGHRNIMHAPQRYYANIVNVNKNVINKFCTSCKTYSLLNGKNIGFRAIKIPNGFPAKTIFTSFYIVCSMCWENYKYEYVYDYEGFTRKV